MVHHDGVHRTKKDANDRDGHRVLDERWNKPDRNFEPQAEGSIKIDDPIFTYLMVDPEERDSSESEASKETGGNVPRRRATATLVHDESDDPTSSRDFDTDVDEDEECQQVDILCAGNRGEVTGFTVLSFMGSLTK